MPRPGVKLTFALPNDRQKVSPFQRHVARWSHCRRCHLCEGRRKVVLARGQVPCEVLFVGEAPGASEDVLGKPFVGSAGHLFDKIMHEAGVMERRYALTNIVACIPRGEDGDKLGEPDKNAIKACAPRLIEFIRLCQPKLIVCVGKLAAKNLPTVEASWLMPWETLKVIEVMHPAAIIRANVANQGLLTQKCVIALSDAMEDL